MSGQSENPAIHLKSKRDRLVCVQCSIRKVKCDKNIPCNNCIRRKVADLCCRPKRRRDEEQELEEQQQQQRHLLLSQNISNITSILNNDSELNMIQAPKRIHIEPPPFSSISTSNKVSELFRFAPLEDYVKSLQSLTFGITHIEGLLPSNNDPTLNEWDWCMDKLKPLLDQLDFESTQLICQFSCRYTTFLHHGIINSLFMKDFDVFWQIEVVKDKNCLIHLQDSNFKQKSPRDYYFWMSLFYSILCLGICFGSDQLYDKLPYNHEELIQFPHVLFRASLDCLFKAKAFEKPDIRTIQIYCVMTTFLHALGNVYLHKQLLKVVIDTAKSLKLDSVINGHGQGDAHLNFHKEIVKRLWHSIYIVDLFSNYPNRLINDFSTPFPYLVNTEQLLQKYPVNLIKSLEFNVGWNKEDDDIAGLLYQRFMVEIGQIKQESHRQASNLIAVKESWNKMFELKKKLDQYFSSQKSYETRNIFNFAKYLLLSSFSRETLDIGSRLLTLLGLENWTKTYRNDCIRLAKNLLTHSTHRNIPSYYNKYWIVIQHLIYACLFVLLDMLMFKSDEDEVKLNSVRGAIPTIKKLRSSHFTAKVGLAVIENLCSLVSCVRLNGDAPNANTIEEISLKKFLHKLEIANPFVSKDQIANISPPMEKSQYLRIGMDDANDNYFSTINSTIDNNEHSNAEQQEIHCNSRSTQFLDPGVDNLLDNAGWLGFLDFFFGGQDENGLLNQNNNNLMR